MSTQPVVESTHGNFWLSAFIAFVLMIMAGSVIHGFLRSRGFGTIGNGFFLFVGLMIGIFAMRGVQSFF